MMHVFAYVAFVAVTFVGLSVGFAGLGLLVRQAFGLRVSDGDELLRSAWIGWSACIALLQVWHLALPSDGRALAFAMTLGAAGLLLNLKDLGAYLRRIRPRQWLFVPVLLLAALWLANQTTTQARHIDSGLYHLMSVKWAHAFAIVPGLGNLRNILAYNNSYFLYVAMLDAGPFLHRSHHLATGLVVYFLLARILFSGWKLAVEKRRPEAWRLFDVLLLVPAIVYAMSDYGSSPSPDVGVWVICLLLASEVLRLLGEAERAGERLVTVEDAAAPSEGGRLFAQPAELGFTVFSIVFLAVIGVTVKLSAAAFGAAAAATTLTAVYAVSRDRRILSRRAWVWMVAAAAFTMGVWMLRSVITSGYPIYPSTAFGFPVDWRMPEDMVRRNARSLCAWGRVQDITVPIDQVLGGWTWLWPWVNHTLRDGFAVALPLILAAGAAPAILWLCRTESERRRQPALSWWFLCVPAAGLVYWFFTSPQPRFAAATFWALGMGALALALRRLERTKALAVVASLALALFAMKVDVIDFLHPWRKDIGPVRQGKMMAVQTDSGLTVYVPKEGDCWDAPLPSTTSLVQLDRRLRLRVPGDLSRGFRIEPPATP